MTSEKGDFPITMKNPVDPSGEQNAGRWDTDTAALQYTTGGASALTSGHVYAYDQAADRGNPQYNPPPGPAPSAPQYPIDGASDTKSGHVYAYDQAADRGNPQYNPPPGPAPSTPPQYPIDGASDTTSGHVYAYDQAADRGNPQYNPPPGPAPSTPPQYPIDGASDTTSGHVYAYDQAADRGNPQYNPPPGPAPSTPPQYPIDGASDTTSGHFYAYDQAAEGESSQYNPPQGPAPSTPQYPIDGASDTTSGHVYAYDQAAEGESSQYNPPPSPAPSTPQYPIDGASDTSSGHVYAYDEAAESESPHYNPPPVPAPSTPQYPIDGASDTTSGHVYAYDQAQEGESPHYNPPPGPAPSTPQYPIDGASDSTSGHVYAYNQAADRGNPQYNPPPGPAPSTPQYPLDSASDTTSGHVYACDQAADSGNPQYDPPPGPAPSTPPQYPIDGASDTTSGHVYAHDQAAEGGNPQFTSNPPRGNTTSAPTQYPGGRTPTPGIQTVSAVVQQPSMETTRRNAFEEHCKILFETKRRNEFEEYIKIRIRYSILVTIFCCFLIGMFAIYYGHRARKYNRAGLTDEAVVYDKRAGRFIVAAYVVGMFFVITCMPYALIKQERQVCNSTFGSTLEDNMAVVSNYPLDGAADYLRKLGVFSTFAPPTRLVPVIATAASANHFRESSLLLENIAQTVIATYPDAEVYFYDMGLTESQKIKIKSFSFVHLRRFPFEDYPPHVSNLKGYTWKPIIIQTVLQEFGFVIWADASVRFTRQNLGKLFSRAKENGIVIRHGHFKLAPHTDIDTFRFLGEPVCPFSEYDEREATLIVVYRTQFINDYVMKPWLSCALLIGCMVTKNSAVLLHTCNTHTIHNECHRFDQSVISMILTRLFQDLTRFDIPPEVRIKYCRGVEKEDDTKPNIIKSVYRYLIGDVCYGLERQ